MVDTNEPTEGSKRKPDLKFHGHGHFFAKKSFHKPTYCHHCAEMLWGLIGQGYICEVCNFVVHDRCMKSVITPCSTIAASLIQYPIAHCWSEPSHFKRKFCNVCRKKLDDSWAVRCEICDYYTHLDCQEFVVNDCKDCASYSTTEDKCRVQYHHWREGNLPSNSKCALCKKTCWSSECLTGMRCDWCGITAHDYCFNKLPNQCDFGIFKPIMLPPSAISIPRVELPKEVILGINLKSIPLNRQIIEEQSSSSSDYKTSKDEVESSGNTTGKRDKSDKDRSDRDDETLSVRVYDGNTAYKRHQNFHTINIHKNATVNEIIAASLRTFHLLDTPDNYYASLITPTNQSTASLFKNDSTVPILNEDPIRDPDPFGQLKQTLHQSQLSSSSYNSSISATSTVVPYPLTTPTFASNTPLSLNSTSQNASNLCNAPGPKTGQSKDNNASLSTPTGGPVQAPSTCTTTLPLVPSGGSSSAARAASLILRSRIKDQDTGTVLVYPGLLRLNTSEPQSIPIDTSMSVRHLISKALPQFGLQNESPNNFQLVEMITDKEVVQRVMDSEEKPWLLLQNISKESLHKMRMTRFYLQDKDDPHGKSVTLFLWNLPPSLSQRYYETIIMSILDKSLKYKCIGPIYYEHGSLVMTYDSKETALKAFNTLKNASCEGKNLSVLLLPNIHPSQIPSGITPLLVFVNVKSGGCQGMGLISSFRKLLNPHQVFDLENGGPLPGLYVFRNVAKYKILICGGDGTVGWVLSCLDNVGQESKCENPPCAVIPLGTGNDLARVLNWGPGYTGGEDAYSLLRDVIEAEEVRLDRWTLVFHPDDKYTDDSKYINCLNNTQNTEDNTQIYIMNNYCGIGLDADISLDFHMARTENPSKFSSRLHNKSVYLKMGLRKMMKRKVGRDLQKDIKLEVDGKEVSLPPVEGLVILNILSWGSGANLWGTEKEDHQFHKPTHYDGMLEIVGVSGVVHMGQIQSGLRSGIRIAQGGHIRITMFTEIPVQVDGEPWLQQPGQCVVLKSALKAAMLRKVKHHKSSNATSAHHHHGSGIHSNASTPVTTAACSALAPYQSSNRMLVPSATAVSTNNDSTLTPSSTQQGNHMSLQHKKQPASPATLTSEQIANLTANVYLGPTGPTPDVSPTTRFGRTSINVGQGDQQILFDELTLSCDISTSAKVKRSNTHPPKVSPTTPHSAGGDPAGHTPSSLRSVLSHPPSSGTGSRDKT